MTCSLDQAFVSSAPTPARLSEILECWLQASDQDYIQARYKWILLTFGGGDDFLWEILDPALKKGFANSEERLADPFQRLVGSIRRR